MTSRRAVILLLAWGLAGAACAGGDDRPSFLPVESQATTTAASAATAVDDTPETVRAGIRNALASLRTAEANVVAIAVPPPDYVGDPPPERRWRWARNAQGDFRSGETTVDAVRGVLRRQTRDRDGAVLVEEVTGLPLESLDTSFGPSARAREDPELMARAVLELAEARVTNTVHDGRPAWVVQALLSPTRVIVGVDHVSVTIDQASGLAVAALFTDKGRPVHEMRVERLVVNRPLPPDEFSPPPPPGGFQGNSTLSGTFRRMGLDAARAAAGFEAPVPARVPDGFAAAEAAVGTMTGRTGATGTVFAAAYRRGFDSFVVTAQLPLLDGVAPAYDALFRQSPVAARAGLTPESVTLAGGRLDGAAASVMVVDPFMSNLLWATTDELVVTVAGDLTRAELLDVAQSLR